MFTTSFVSLLGWLRGLLSRRRGECKPYGRRNGGVNERTFLPTVYPLCDVSNSFSNIIFDTKLIILSQNAKQKYNFVVFRRTLLRCFDTQFCGIMADTFAVFWQALLWLGEDYGGEAEGFEELLELGFARF